MLKPRQLKIVLIDDNEHLRTSLQQLLVDLGHSVHGSATGEFGLELVRDHQPDILICDIALEGSMNGYGVARAIRLNTSLNRVFLAALSGNSSQEDRERSARAGFDRHVAKPASGAEITDLLDEAWRYRVRLSAPG